MTCQWYRYLLPLPLFLVTVSAAMINVTPPVTTASLGLARHSHTLHRRDWLLTAAIATASCLSPSASLAIQDIPTNLAPTSAGRRGCSTSTNPSQTVVTCRGDLVAFNPDGTGVQGFRHRKWCLDIGGQEPLTIQSTLDVSYRNR